MGPFLSYARCSKLHRCEVIGKCCALPRLPDQSRLSATVCILVTRACNGERWKRAEQATAPACTAASVAGDAKREKPSTV